MPKLTLWPSGEVLEANEKENLLVQLTNAGHKIRSSCGGHATCGDCVIVVKGGDSSCTAPTFEELRLLGNVFHITKERLSCQTKLMGDVVIDITAHTKRGSKKASAVSKGPSVIVRKKEDVQETALKSQEKVEVKKEDDWYRHWDKPDADASKVPAKLGGGKRPRPFKTNNEDSEE